MKKAFWILGLSSALLVSACSDLGDKHYATTSDGTPAARAAADDDADDADDEKIALDRVPGSVMQAALAAVPGLVIQAAEKEVKAGVTVYNLEGRVGSDEYDVEVTADGKVREIEKNDEDGDEGDDGDDD